MKTILVLLMVSVLGLADNSQWAEYKKSCEKTGGKAYKVKADRFECKKQNRAKHVDANKVNKKKTVEGAKYREGIDPMISAKF